MTPTIASLTPTVAALCGVAPPVLSAEPPVPAVMSAAAIVTGGRPVERCLVYAPDALGAFLWNRFPDEFAAVLADAPCKIPVVSVAPPKTPVCYASVFTGAQPAAHGIRKYEKPVLACDTLFDAFVRTGRRVALAAVKESSIDLIFRNRPLAYHTEPDDAAVVARATALIEADACDLLVAYVADYDDGLHATEPLSGRCLAAMRAHLRDFRRLAAACARAWAGRPYALVFAPDHGAHVDPATGRGDHGLVIPEDMDLFHCYGING